MIKSLFSFLQRKLQYKSLFIIQAVSFGTSVIFAGIFCWKLLLYLICDQEVVIKEFSSRLVDTGHKAFFFVTFSFDGKNFDVRYPKNFYNEEVARDQLSYLQSDGLLVNTGVLLGKRHFLLQRHYPWKQNMYFFIVLFIAIYFTIFSGKVVGKNSHEGSA